MRPAAFCNQSHIRTSLCGIETLYDRTVSKELESNKRRVPERMRSCTAGSDNIRGISMVPIIVEKITKKFFSLFCFRLLPMPSVYEDRPSRHASIPDQPAVRQLLLSPRLYQECRGQSDLSH